MSLVGKVFNKALSKNISVYIANSGPGFKRATVVIGQDVKERALASVKEAFESGALFNAKDMKKTERLTITHLFHESKRDPNPHCSVYAQTNNSVIVKDGHVMEDPSKQTLVELVEYPSKDYQASVVFNTPLATYHDITSKVWRLAFGKSI